MKEINLRTSDVMLEEKQKIGVGGWIFIVLMSFYFICAVALICVNDTSNSSSNNNGNSKSIYANLTYSNYLKIENNMTYRQVADIFGFEGELEYSSSYGNYTYETYEWENKDEILVYVTVHFTNGKVTSKSQWGLE